MQRILFLLLFFISIITYGQTNPNHVYVKGYTRKDGTHVKGYYRTAPNNTNRDNFSTKGNSNPYTGEAGWVKPDNYTKSYNNYSTKSNISYSSNAQYQGTFNEKGQKVINYSNGKEVFGLCGSCYTYTIDPNLKYYWYSPYKGVIESKGKSEGTLLDGEYKFYDEDGNLKISSNYKKGLKDGYEIILDENGDIAQKSHYDQGELNYYKFRNEENYIIELEGQLFKEGSIKKVYTDQGKLIEESFFIEGLKSHYKIYNEDSGSLELEFTKDFNDHYFGNYIVYYPNQIIKFRGFFENGFPDAIWKWYNEDGDLVNTLTYRVSENFYPNGDIKLKGSEYYDSIDSTWIRDKTWYFYSSNKSTNRKKIIYKDGEIQDLK